MKRSNISRLSRAFTSIKVRVMNAKLNFSIAKFNFSNAKFNFSIAELIFFFTPLPINNALLIMSLRNKRGRLSFI